MCCLCYRHLEALSGLHGVDRPESPIQGEPRKAIGPRAFTESRRGNGRKSALANARRTLPMLPQLPETPKPAQLIPPLPFRRISER